MTELEFVTYLKKNGLELNQDQLDKLSNYQKLLEEQNKVMNLTGITDKEEVYEKHFLDSLLFSFNENFDGKKGIDVGSGAGFPGLVLAICYPNFHLTLLEPLNKRCNFLNLVISTLSLNNVEVVNKRCEDFCKDHREEFDYAFARAVSKLNILLEMIIPLIKVNGYFVALKGKIFYEEISLSENAIKKLNVVVDKIKEDILPSDKDIRGNIFIKKLKKTDIKYPRNYGQIKKHPL